MNKKGALYMVHWGKWSKKLLQQFKIGVDRLCCVLGGSAFLQLFPIISVSMEKVSHVS